VTIIFIKAITNNSGTNVDPEWVTITEQCCLFSCYVASLYEC
jgi:hypothetical protein